MRTMIGMVFTLVLALAPNLAAAAADPAPAADARPLLQVFYKEKAPSLQTRERVGGFLDSYQTRYDIRYLVITDTANVELIHALGLPTEHFPFALAIDGKTSARIGETVVTFAHFPDFMHHVGKHQGNWTLAHLEAVLQDPALLLPENPVVETSPGGGGEHTQP